MSHQSAYTLLDISLSLLYYVSILCVYVSILHIDVFVTILGPVNIDTLAM